MKVFSVKRMKKSLKRQGKSDEAIQKSCLLWANSIDGQNVKHLRNKGFAIHDRWTEIKGRIPWQ